jgi:D-alanyl-D-alanine carboxypeptidase/D-alanyl-D-alanine-endopeptidase (penicillin-binding protein 4)
MTRPTAVLASLLALLAVVLLAPAAHAAGLAATRAGLWRHMAQAGPSSGAYVVDLGTGRTVFSVRPDVPRTPASVEKLYTTSTVLVRFGPTGRLATEVVSAARPDPVTGVLDGDLYLRGGGDPTFGAVGLATLAGRLADAGLTTVTGRVLGDETAFDRLRGTPATGYRTSGYVGPLSALTFNRGLTGLRAPYFQFSPPLAAARAFRRELRRAGVRVLGRATIGTAPPAAVTLAAQLSPPMADLVRATNVPSDNFAAEILLKGLGARFGGAGSTAAGAAVVRATVSPFGIAPRVVDGSGLGRTNATTPRQVVGLLMHMAKDEPEAEPAFVGSLPVVGRTGTLRLRMRGTAAQDRCRGKTGSLIGVSALAGYCTTTSGAKLAFAILMNRVNVSGARVLQDRMVAALARYSAGSSVRVR